jgi:hypothetical protein
MRFLWGASDEMQLVESPALEAVAELCRSFSGSGDCPATENQRHFEPRPPKWAFLPMSARSGTLLGRRNLLERVQRRGFVEHSERRRI